ncbi:MAG: BadF/BadG/BcrA/BcrD ATPase family protein [Candidatus Humimicrobiaceae bacterium]
MDYILGVDGGGTKTIARITGTKGNTLAQKEAASSNYHSVGLKKATKNLNDAVFSCIETMGENVRFISSCFGFAGYNTEEEGKYYKKIVFNDRLSSYLNKDKVRIFNDTRVGLAAGSDKENKLILIAGTGSNCIGVNEDGMQAKANGWDYILADEGSGYSIGLKALRAVARSYDGRGDKTLLYNMVIEKLNLDSFDELVQWTYQQPFSKDRIGSLSKIVCAAAQKGDRVSQKILHEEADEAIITATTVIKKLGIGKKDFDLVLVGGNFKCEEFFKNIITEDLKSKYKNINFVVSKQEPVHGAIKLAIDNL